ncbi:hypothetical protein A9263_15175 [Vibrio cyclitrophicus]|uniref:glycosyltransferase family 2 protein n=1 Tax=Vibrio cyclitrophicus TaxID=47951 RepID=UPI0007EEC790|nr:glycosyltransferase family 2 protein [Vibrio cyclitrophicus]OBT19341.1 hypothetical protein A9263_15175 [Vibrio cyclitrophicus]
MEIKNRINVCSVIITGKNCSGTISNTLNSLNYQEGVDKLELIFVDDGSEDNSAKIVKDYPFKSFIKLEYYYNPIGRAKSLNFAISKSSFDYICILDADDEFHKDKVKIQLEAMYDNPTCSMLATGFLVGEKPPSNFYNEIASPGVREFTSFLLKDFLIGNPVCHSSVMLKRNVALYNVNRRKQVDLNLWLDLAKNNHEILYLKWPLTFKRIHKHQSFEANGRLKYALSSYLLTISYAKPIKKFKKEIIIRTLRLVFHLLPRKLTSMIKGR